MPKLIILGSSSAVPDVEHENTHLALKGMNCFILIDCANNPMVRLVQAGLDPMAVTDLVLTHFHPDHVTGVASLLMGTWLMGRKLPLNIYGLDYTIDSLIKLMELYDWNNWPKFFPIHFHRLPDQELAPVLENDEFRILSSPVRHLIPTVGLRIEARPSGKVLAYSCDTEPCQAVVRLGAGAEILIHESTGAGLGHSSAAQAGEIARQAGARQLYLIHYSKRGEATRLLVQEAEAAFSGPVVLAHDFLQVDF